MPDNVPRVPLWDSRGTVLRARKPLQLLIFGSISADCPTVPRKKNFFRYLSVPIPLADHSLSRSPSHDRLTIVSKSSHFAYKVRRVNPNSHSSLSPKIVSHEINSTFFYFLSIIRCPTVPSEKILWHVVAQTFGIVQFLQRSFDVPISESSLFISFFLVRSST